MTSRPALVALVVALVLGLAAPARADSASTARRRQAAVRAKRAHIAAQLDAARASDRQLAAAVRELDSNIGTQQAAAAAATQASQAANAAVAAGTARLDDTRRRRDSLRRTVKQRALLAYVSPGETVLSEVLSSRDITEATRKRALLDQVVGGEHELLDRLRVSEEDLADEQRQLSAAQAKAAARRRQATARLVALRAARADHFRLRSALQDRIREYMAEAEAVAKDEAALQAFIRAHDVRTPGDVIDG